MILSFVLIVNNFEYSEMIFDRSILAALNSHGAVVDEVVQKVFINLTWFMGNSLIFLGRRDSEHLLQ